jgi:hypothetical protein
VTGSTTHPLELLEQMIQQQRRKLTELAAKINPQLTPDDLLQPHDRPELARDAQFNFEDGILSGLISAQLALRAALRDAEQP